MRIIAFNLFLSFGICLLASCAGVGGNDGTSSNNANSINKASQTLRLGQASSPTSPVAVSAAINNRENLVLLNNVGTIGDIEHALYTATDGSVVRITLGENGLPESAATLDATITFTNYTATTVDITIFIADSPVLSSTVPLIDSALALTRRARRLARSDNDNSQLTALLANGASATRIFGCSIQDANVDVPALLSLASASCGSLLLDTVEELIRRRQDVTEIIVPDIPESSGCNFNQPGWANNFANALSCAGTAGSELVEVVLEDNPDIDLVTDDAFDPELGIVVDDPNDLDDDGIPDSVDDIILDDDIIIDDDIINNPPTPINNGGDDMDDGSDDGGNSGGDDGGDDIPPIPEPQLPGEPTPESPN